MLDRNRNRIRSAAVGRALAAIVVLLVLAVSFVSLQARGASQRSAAQSSTVNVLTYHNGLTRQGANTSETILTPSNVNYNTFGKLWTFSTDGTVDAQPLYVSSLNMGTLGTHNVLFVATENDTLYAIDANSAAVLWQTSLLLPNETPSDNRGCNQITPLMGITSTPVIEVQNTTIGGLIFAVAMSKDSSGNYHQRLHSIGISAGVEQTGSPIDIQGTYPSTGPQSSGGLVTFSPGSYKARPALLLVNSTVYVEFSGNCDTPPYSGWVFAYKTSPLSQSAVLNVTPNGQDGALWGSGGGPAADANGSIYLMVGNGTFDTTLSGTGFPSQGDYGNSFLRLAWSSGVLQVADYFASFNAADGFADERVELGSSSPLLLPAMTNSSGQSVNLAIGAGKLGTVFLVNTANMGKYNANGSNTNVYQQVVGALGPGGDGNDALGAVRTPPVYFNNMVYFAANLDPIEAFSFNNALMSTLPVSSTARIFNYPGAALSVSSNGTGNGILWAAAPGTPAMNGGLAAYQAGNLGKQLYTSNGAPNARDQFTYAKFAPPTVANGMVYVATTTGVVAFGLLP
jgi:hypothetical protein